MTNDVKVSPFTMSDDIESRIIEFIKNSTPEVIVQEFRSLVQKGLNCDATERCIRAELTMCLLRALAQYPLVSSNLR